MNITTIERPLKDGCQLNNTQSNFTSIIKKTPNFK